MKQFLFAAILFSGLTIFGCGSTAEGNQSKDDAVEIDEPIADKANLLLIGKWQVDSAGFINDDVKKPLEAPLADAFWEFTDDGQLKITGNISYSTPINIVDNSFKVNMMNVESVYRIISLTDKELVLHSTIIDTKEMKMETVAKLKKLSN